MDPLTVSAGKLLTDLGGRLLDVYKLRRDGSYFDQQEFLAELKHKEIATLQSNEIEKDYRQAAIGVLVKTEQERRERQLGNSPFSHTPEEIRTLVSKAAEANKPVLLIAPFYQDHLSNQENDDGPQAFRVAVRRSWLNQLWHGDMTPMDGVFKRPLRNTDVDVSIIREVLAGLPTVLVYGEIQGKKRVWASIEAWNIVDEQNNASIHVSLPPISFSAESQSFEALASDDRIELEDHLGRTVATTAAVFGEWFHLIRHGRAPRLHRMLPPDMGDEQRSVAAGLGAAYAVAHERGVVDKYTMHLEQAEMFAEAGLQERAVANGKLALDDLRESKELDNDDGREQLRRLARAFRIAKDGRSQAEVLTILEESARADVLRTFGWDE